jgi:hypothetical protein
MGGELICIMNVFNRLWAFSDYSSAHTIQLSVAVSKAPSCKSTPKSPRGDLLKDNDLESPPWGVGGLKLTFEAAFCVLYFAITEPSVHGTIEKMLYI